MQQRATVMPAWISSGPRAPGARTAAGRQPGNANSRAADNLSGKLHVSNLTAKARRREDHFGLVPNWARVHDPAPTKKNFASSRLRGEIFRLGARRSLLLTIELAIDG